MKQKKSPPCEKCGQWCWDWNGLNTAAGDDNKGVADMYRCKNCGHVITDTLVIYECDFIDATGDFIDSIS